MDQQRTSGEKVDQPIDTGIVRGEKKSNFDGVRYISIAAGEGFGEKMKQIGMFGKHSMNS